MIGVGRRVLISKIRERCICQKIEINDWAKAPNVLINNLVWSSILSLLCLILFVLPAGYKSKIENSVLDGLESPKYVLYFGT